MKGVTEYLTPVPEKSGAVAFFMRRAVPVKYYQSIA